jgi:hypothetical protein
MVEKTIGVSEFGTEMHDKDLSIWGVKREEKKSAGAIGIPLK